MLVKQTKNWEQFFFGEKSILVQKYLLGRIYSWWTFFGGTQKMVKRVFLKKIWFAKKNGDKKILFLKKCFFCGFFFVITVFWSLMSLLSLLSQLSFYCFYCHYCNYCHCCHYYPILDTRISCSVLHQAQGTPEIWNGLDWRALVKEIILNWQNSIGKTKRIAYFSFLAKKKKHVQHFHIRKKWFFGIFWDFGIF